MAVLALAPGGFRERRHVPRQRPVRVNERVTARRQHLPYYLHNKQTLVIDLRGPEKDVDAKNIADSRQRVAAATELPLRNIEVVPW